MSFDRRVTVVAGLGLAFVSAATYTSYANRSVVGRWSPMYAGLLLAFAVAVVGVARWAWLRPSAPTTSARAFALAVLAWGAGSAAAAAGDRAEAGRLADGVVFGSAVPMAVVLDGLSVVCLIAAAVSWIWARRTARWAGLGVAAATGAVLFGLGESAVRVRAVISPRTQGFPTYTSALWQRRYVRLNSRGFRDAEPDRGRRERCRLAVVGDSYAFGVGIANVDQRLGEQLTRQLAVATGATWRSINVSRGDTHTLQHIAFLNDLTGVEPDVVILLYVFNDIDYLRPVTARGALTEAPSSWVARLDPRRLAFRNSFLVQEVFLLARMATERLRVGDRMAADPYGDSAVVAHHLVDLDRFVVTARTLGAAVYIAPMDVGVVDGGYSLKRYQAFTTAAGVQGLPVLSLADAYLGWRRADLVVSRFDGHPNERADSLAAATLARAVAGTRPRCATAEQHGRDSTHRAAPGRS